MISRTNLSAAPAAAWMVAAVCMGTVGCGGSDGVTKVPVSGTATFKGVPSLGGFDLSIIPQDGPPAVAAVGPDGAFATEAVPGPAQVVVLFPPTAAGHGEAGKAAKAVGVLPAYTRGTSTLQIQIAEKGSTDLVVEVGR